MSSGPIMRNILKRAGLAEYKHYWRFLAHKCDLAFGPGWRASSDGISVGGVLVVPIGKVREFLEGEGAAPSPVPAMPAVVPSPIAPVLTGMPVEKEAPVERDPAPPAEPDAPTFECKEKGCSYVGYTKKALEAHCRRTGH